MKCEDLKELLNSRDERNKITRENTIECFNLIKDFVIDDFIKESIDSNFCQSGHYIDGAKVYRKLFEIKGIDSSKIFSRWFSFDWSNEFYVIKTKRWSPPSEDYDDCSHDAENQVEEFFENFDRELFKNLVENHLRASGFRNVKIRNLRGNMVETDAFYASRSTIEKACCHQAKPSRTELDEEKNNGVVFAVVIMVMVLIAASFIIFQENEHESTFTNYFRTDDDFREYHIWRVDVYRCCAVC